MNDDEKSLEKDDLKLYIEVERGCAKPLISDEDSFLEKSATTTPLKRRQRGSKRIVVIRI